MSRETSVALAGHPAQTRTRLPGKTDSSPGTKLLSWEGCGKEKLSFGRKNCRICTSPEGGLLGQGLGCLRRTKDNLRTHPHRSDAAAAVLWR
jgi:hypothetical protein